MIEKISVFLSYSHNDAIIKQQFEKHLRSLERTRNIRVWSDNAIIPGQNWNPEIFNNLLSSQIIVLLISPDFIASDFCYVEEMSRALQLHDSRKAVVIPVMLRSVPEGKHPFEKIQTLPDQPRFVSDWPDQDKAFVNVVNGIEKAIDYFLKDLNNRDIEFRKNEVISFVTEDNLIKACNRLIDFCKEFSTSSKDLIRAMTIKATCNVLLQAGKHREVDDQIFKMLELLEEIYPTINTQKVA